MQDLYFSVFGGRHPLPNNPIALYNEAETYDCSDMKRYRNEKAFGKFQAELNDNKSRIYIYVTGYTPAIIDILDDIIIDRVFNITDGNKSHRTVTFLHYNPKTQSYQQQIV